MGHSGANLTRMIGRLGSGKTFHMVFNAWLDYYSGKIILTNMKGLKIKNFYVNTEDLMTMLTLLNPNRLYSLYLDEISQEGDSYEFLSDHNKRFSKFIAQARKRNMDITYTTQWKKGEIPRLRNLLDYEVKCYSFRDQTNPDPFTNLYGFYYVKEDADTGRRTRTWMDKATCEYFFKFYDTKEIIINESA